MSRLSAFTDRAAARAKSQANAADLSDHLQHARGVAEPYVHSALERLEPYVSNARDSVAPYVTSARDNVATYVDSARDRLTPVAEKTMASAQDIASHKLKPAYDQAVATTRETVAPAVSTALANAATSTAPARAEAKVRGSAALAALRGEVVARPRSRWRLVAGVLLLGAIAGAAASEIARRMSSRGPAVSPTPLRPTTVTIPDPPVKANKAAEAEASPGTESPASDESTD